MGLVFPKSKSLPCWPGSDNHPLAMTDRFSSLTCCFAFKHFLIIAEPPHARGRAEPFRLRFPHNPFRDHALAPTQSTTGGAGNPSSQGVVSREASSFPMCSRVVLSPQCRNACSRGLGL
eukprot:4382237-Pyramimonas_sp.AAC.1